MRRETEGGQKSPPPFCFSPSSVPHNNTPVFMPLRRQACRVIWIISKRLPSVGKGKGGGETRTLYILEGDHNHDCFLVCFGEALPTLQQFGSIGLRLIWHEDLYQTTNLHLTVAR